jgi:hypothetical protein
LSIEFSGDGFGVVRDTLQSRIVLCVPVDCSQLRAAWWSSHCRFRVVSLHANYRRLLGLR